MFQLFQAAQKLPLSQQWEAKDPQQQEEDIAVTSLHDSSERQKKFSEQHPSESQSFGKEPFLSLVDQISAGQLIVTNMINT